MSEQEDEREARFQQFINGPSSKGAQLRDAFAQLLAMGQSGAVPAEALWARQGLDQLTPTPPDSNITRSPPMAERNQNQNFTIPMPQIQSADPTLDFPTGTPPQDPRMKGASKPFPGAKEIEIKPYELPKKKKKQKDKD